MNYRHDSCIYLFPSRLLHYIHFFPKQRLPLQLVLHVDASAWLVYPNSLAVRLSLHIHVCLKSRPGFLSPHTSNRLNRRSSFWLPTSSMTVPRGICLTVCKSRYLQHHHVPCALLGILSFLFCHDPAPGFCDFGVRFSHSLKFHSDIGPCL